MVFCRKICYDISDLTKNTIETGKKMENRITEGKVMGSLFRFALPVLVALFLQALYGAVDLWVVGQFAETADVSGVATGSMVMHTFTMIVTGLAMGITVLVGRRIGEKNPEEAGKAIGNGIFVFIFVAVGLTVLLTVGAEMIARFMQAPQEAFAQTATYLRICGIGSVFIVAYNVLGSIFRGIGDSKTPLITVIIACILNIICDVILVKCFKLGTAGAAIATVFSQAVSVLLSLIMIRRKQLPFAFSMRCLRPRWYIIGEELRIGTPVAMQELLVGVSFLVIQMIVNSIDVVSSAGVGVAEKVCAFLMLVPSAYMQSIAAFVAQNLGANRPDRAKKALLYSILTSLAMGVIMCALSLIWGDVLAGIFSKDPLVIAAGHSYLKAFGIDCVLTPFLFCFIGYYNGHGKTLFVMLQGLVGAFCVRIPVVYFVSRIAGVTLFQIGLGTPASTTVQIIMCLILYAVLEKKSKAALALDQ